MSNLQIYAGLAPIALGLAGLVVAQLQLQSIRQRKLERQADGSILTAPRRVTTPAASGALFHRFFVWKPIYKYTVVILIVLITGTGIYTAFDFDRSETAGGELRGVTFQEAIGTDVLDAQNKKIGEVSDFLVHDKNRTPTVIIQESTTKGQKTVELPFADLNWQRVQGDSDDDGLTAKVRNRHVQKQILQAFNPAPAVGSGASKQMRLPASKAEK